MRPPISSTSCAEIARPSPVPPYSRVVEASACSNGLEDPLAACPAGCRCRCRATAKCSTSPSSPRAGDASTLDARTSPRSVNLIALPTRLTRICRSRAGVADDGVGHVGRDVAGELEPLLVRPHGRACAACRPTSSRRSNGVAVELELARLDLREVEDVVDDRQQRLGRVLARSSRYSRCSASQRRVEQQLGHADEPFIGVRISWLMLARNSLLARLAASAASRAACSSARRPSAR